MRSVRLALLGIVLGGLARVEAACPEADELRRALEGLDLDGVARLARFASPFPEDLHGEAARKVGQAVAARQGDRVFGVMVAEIDLPTLWKAINDEDHHALDGSYVPVRHSAVIGGTPRGESRLLFQYYQQLGIGRWWVSRVSMNRELYESSARRYWELVWQDEMDAVDPTRPPIDAVASRMAGIRASRGSWLLVPLGERCTLVEHFSWTDPGGFVGFAQALMAKRAVRDTLEGVVRMAREHVSAPHPGASFVRPDGTALD